jgi:hypothetical protein
MFNIDPKKVGSINEGGRKLKVGTHAYKITGASMAIVKSNPTGKEQQVIFDLLNGKDYGCKLFLNVMSSNDVVCEIAQKTLVAIAEAAGIGGVLKPERLKGFIGKSIVITAKETQGKGEKKDQTYVNLSTVEAFEDDADEEDEAEVEEEEDEVEADDDAEEESEEEEADEEPEPPKKKPAAGKGKRPW